MSAPPGLPPPEELLKRAEEVLGELEKGPWPSHVKELRKTRYPLHIYGVGLVARKSPWGPGAVTVKYVNTGVLSRWSREWVPKGGEETHFRVFHTPGKFWKTDFVRQIIKISRELGVGLIELVGQTGAFVLNLTKDKAEEMVDALRSIGTDVGGSGDAIRSLNACVGPALCEFALYDTLKWYAEFHKDKRINDAIATPNFPYKFKIKFSGCPMDCTRANRADLGFIGIWEGAPEVDQELLRRKIEAGEVDPEKLAANCPSGAITWDKEKKELKIDGTRCKKSMHCIRSAFPAVKPGKNRKIAVVVGGHVKGRFGGKMGKPLAIVNSVDEAMDWVVKTVEAWMNGLETGVSKHKDRIGDFIMKVGFKKYTEEILGVKVPYKPSLHGRLGAGAVLDDGERKMWLDWANNIVKEYEGRI